MNPNPNQAMTEAERIKEAPTQAVNPAEPKPPEEKPKRRLDDLMKEAAQIKVLVDKINSIEKRVHSKGGRPNQIIRNHMRGTVDSLKGSLSKAKRSLGRVEAQLQKAGLL